MALIALLRGELLDTWQNQLPKNAPNYFALNILPNDKQAFTDKLLELSAQRSEEHTSELQSLMRISYAVFCLKTLKQLPTTIQTVKKPNTIHSQYMNKPHHN